MPAPCLFQKISVIGLSTLVLLTGCQRIEESARPIASASLPAPATSASPSKAAAAAFGEKLVKRFAATYDYDELFAESIIQQELHALMGPEYQHLHTNMSQIREPIDVIAGTLAIYGHRKDWPEREEAVVCLSFRPLKAHVGIYSGNVMTIYSATTEYERLPTCILHWVYLNTQAGGIDSPPQQGDSEFQFKRKSSGSAS